MAMSEMKYNTETFYRCPKCCDYSFAELLECCKIVIDPNQPLEPLEDRIKREMNSMAEFFDNNLERKE